MVFSVSARLGDKEQALQWLEKAYQQRNEMLAFQLKIEPAFDALHQDPRFQDLVRRVGLPP